MATIEHIEAFYAAQSSVKQLLLDAEEISLANDLENLLAKTLVVATASYFEDFLTEFILSHIRKHSSDPSVPEFCRTSAIQQRYHTWFDWNVSNANKFFSLFGEAIRNKAANSLRVNGDLVDAVAAFMFLGSQRNLIVHRNMLAYTLPDTSDQIIGKARQALIFINFLTDDLFS